jgi:methyltransferase (TIGR00027 family)
MLPDPQPLRHISDTALWTAAIRAHESERPDALFRDTLARRLAGERGECIRQQMPAVQEWAFVTRTVLFDRAIAARVASGTRTVVNLGAGLDTRPYRLDLPPELRWVEIDLPKLLEVKAAAITPERPKCRLERSGLDLSNRPARQAALDRIGQGLAITEGLTIYLAEEEVAALAQDLSAAEFDYWLLDLASPALLTMLQATTGRVTAAAGAPLKFAPRDGVKFFEHLGWTPLAVESVFDAAMQLGRVPKDFLTAPPPPPGPDGPIWSGVVLLDRRL